jgi:hypothetical protein
LNNELRILPLRKFEVTFIKSINQNDVEETETFTADLHAVIDNHRNVFYRTGNIIREYQVPLMRIVVTPADDETVPA